VYLPKHLVIISVSSQIHSKKPNLAPVFELFDRHTKNNNDDVCDGNSTDINLDADASTATCSDNDNNLNGIKYLEIFSRNLAPHFMSFGNETLKFQEKMYFNILK
jgi:hypothetical protein